MFGHTESASEAQAGESFCSDVKKRIEPDQPMYGGIFKYRYRAAHTNQNNSLKTQTAQPSTKSSPSRFTNNSYAPKLFNIILKVLSRLTVSYHNQDYILIYLPFST